MSIHVNSRTEILYVSSVPDEAEFRRIKGRLRPGVQSVTYGMSEASFLFHSLIQQGLVANGCHVHSLVGRAVSRRLHRGFFWRQRRSSPAPGLSVHHLATPSPRGLKNAWLAASFVVHARRWERRTRGASQRAVIVDAAYVSAVPGVLRALRGSDVVALGVFADLYSYMADVSDASDRRVGLLHSVGRRAVAVSASLMDGYVVLTRQMADVVNPEGKPYLVMEGLVDVRESLPGGETLEKTAHPTVLYSGALRREYGLETLVRGFQAWDEPAAELLLYGQGDYVTELTEIAAADPRITYLGVVPRPDLVEAQHRAWLLVNPRPAEEEFTAYSFPSKVMEYLASGTPVLTTRMPGLPPEYLDHVLTIDEPGPPGVAAALAKALAEGTDRLAERGARGRAFVREQKNNVRQAARILDLVQQCAR
jgi:glycosyltransferase involved in cell wall biosynthesis